MFHVINLDFILEKMKIHVYTENMDKSISALQRKIDRRTVSFRYSFRYEYPHYFLQIGFDIALLLLL